MNRMQSKMLAGALGALILMTGSARAGYMTAGAATPSYPSSPRVGGYVGGQTASGYYGGYILTEPTRSYRSSAGSFTKHRANPAYDPSGRHDGLARPWLR
ncbi:hypothetical protein [Singulisphaera sp. PoT]|uniref:hypothetical protein n=1 Tax=Singulisphaera sp. PoT TaxID=3411797 RepID=UPI003BF48F69